MQTPPPFSSFTHIKYWPTWISISLFFILAWMPFGVRLKVGKILGMLTYWLARERRYITRINIRMCFPELDETQQDQLVKKSFQENGIGLVETTTGWVRKPGTFRDQTTLIGLDKLEEAQALGRGILLIGAHYSTLDFGANLLSLFHPFAVTYRPHRNALFDAFMLRGRLSNCNGVFDRNDIRGTFRHLKEGKTVWYAPDQDYGPGHAVYAPFFGNNAATITASSRFASFNSSPAFLIRQHRVNRTQKYETEFIPLPASFPSDDANADAALINSYIENAIRKYPEQYLWMHKRFKTQPGGKPESPYIDISTPNHRLSEKQYKQVMDQASQVSEVNHVCDFKLQNGMWLRQYPGMISKLPFIGHEAIKFDRKSKKLRIHGINCITVDNFFRVPSEEVSAVTYFVPAGELLGSLSEASLPLAKLARFMVRLHDLGIDCPKPTPDLFISTETDIAVMDPTDFEFRNSPLGLKERRQTIISLTKNFHLSGANSDLVFANYANAAGLNLTGSTHA